MGLNDWLLALHLLSAFSLVASMIVFWVAIVAIRHTDLPEQVVAAGRLFPVAAVAVTVGSLGTIIFGIWLAISLDRYQVWDGWVLAAIVLWAIAVEVGRRGGTAYGTAGMEAGRLAAAGTATSPEVAATFGASRAFWLHTASSVLILLILIDMIWKPGA